MRPNEQKNQAPEKTSPQIRPKRLDTKKTVIYIALIFIFAVLQTTVFSRYRLFGAVPDITLAFAVAVAFFENEYYASSLGLFAGITVEALGLSSSLILPLIYMLICCFASIIKDKLLSKNFVSFEVLSACSFAVIALYKIALSLISSQTGLVGVISFSVIPEFFSSLVFSPLPFLIVRGEAFRKSF